MVYILDTNVALFYLRAQQNSPKAIQVTSDINRTLAPFSPANVAVISVVTHAELLSLGGQNKWGAPRIDQLHNFLNCLTIVDINDSDSAMLQAYFDVDLYSQGLHPAKALKRSAVNMGKNDLWIASTAIASDAELITTDKDFLHLDGVFFKVHYFPV